MGVCLWMLHLGSSLFPSLYFLSITRLIVFATCFCHLEIPSHHAHRINRANIYALRSLKTWALITFFLFQVFFTMTKILINVYSLIIFYYKLDSYYTDLHMCTHLCGVRENLDFCLSLGFVATDSTCWDIWLDNILYLYIFLTCQHGKGIWPQSGNMFGSKGDSLKSLLCQ